MIFCQNAGPFNRYYPPISHDFIEQENERNQLINLSTNLWLVDGTDMVL